MPRKSPSLSLGAAATRRLLAPVRRGGSGARARYPGDSLGRQPVHTVYGGAHLFTRRHRAEAGRARAARARRVRARRGERSPRRSARARADAAASRRRLRARRATSSARAGRGLPHRLRGRLRQPPRRRGGRPRAAPPRARWRAGCARARCRRSSASASSRSPTSCARARAAHARPVPDRRCVARRGGSCPTNFVVTLPKVTMPEQVAALVELFERSSGALGLAPGALRIEIMVETHAVDLRRRRRARAAARSSRPRRAAASARTSGRTTTPRPATSPPRTRRCAPGVRLRQAHDAGRARAAPASRSPTARRT